MAPISIAALALAMSTDAFAAAVGKGAALQRPRWAEALRTGLIFGTIEALTPIVGWALGSAAARYVTAWDHWIAFGLLAALGVHMIHAGVRASPERLDERPDRHGFWLLAIGSFCSDPSAIL